MRPCELEITCMVLDVSLNSILIGIDATTSIRFTVPEPIQKEIDDGTINVVPGDYVGLRLALPRFGPDEGGSAIEIPIIDGAVASPEDDPEGQRIA